MDTQQSIESFTIYKFSRSGLSVLNSVMKLRLLGPFLISVYIYREYISMFITWQLVFMHVHIYGPWRCRAGKQG